MVVDCRLKSGVVVVAEYVHPIKVFVQLLHVVALVDVFDARRYRHGEKQTGSSRLLRLPVELLSEFLKSRDDPSNYEDVLLPGTITAKRDFRRRDFRKKT